MTQEQKTYYPTLKVCTELPTSPRRGILLERTEDYIEEYFARNKGLSPSNYAIGDKVITA